MTTRHTFDVTVLVYNNVAEISLYKYDRVGYQTDSYLIQTF
jgi:hypothetical protein